MSELLAIRRARPLDSYPALLYRGEDVSAILRMEPCACGGSVVQWRDETPMKAVQAHNASPSHRVWRSFVDAAAGSCAQDRLHE